MLVASQIITLITQRVLGYVAEGAERYRVIEAEKYLLEVSRYLHLNPVRGVVLGQGTPIERRERLREYRWSSYRGYAGIEKMRSFLDGAPIQGVFQTYSGRSWVALEYRRWVEEGLIGEIEDPFAAVKWQQVLGGEGFLRELKDHWNQRVERPKKYGQTKNWSAVGAQQVLELVSEHFESDLETLKEGGARKNLARRCAITLCSGSHWIES